MSWTAVIKGNENGNILRLGKGNDHGLGRGGSDTLLGGPGADDLNGGAGSNTNDGGDGTDTCISPNTCADGLNGESS